MYGKPESDIQSFLAHEELFQLQIQKRELCSLLVYNFKCNSCNAEYIGKTKEHYKTQTSEHTGVSPLTGKCVKDSCLT